MQTLGNLISRIMSISSTSAGVKRLPPVIVLGATGTGKSKLAIAIAKKFDGEVINADAMQIYEGLDVITNKVTPEETDGIPHHLLGFLDPLKRFSVVDFRNRCLPLMDDLIQRGKLPVIVGGTHYYLESVLWKVLVDEEKESERLLYESDRKRKGTTAETVADLGEFQIEQLLDPEVHLKDVSSPKLHNLLKRLDPRSAEELHRNDKRKIMRSLQVFAQYGRPHSEILAEQRASQGGNSLGGALRFPEAIMIWIQCNQEVLDKRLDDRVDKMVTSGLVDEIRNFVSSLPEDFDPDYSKGIFQSIGLKEFREFFSPEKAGREPHILETWLQQGIDDMKRRTRGYARKQSQWIRNRFINRKDRHLPKVYGIDASDLSQWEDVERTAFEIVEDAIHERASRWPVIPQKEVEEPDKKERNVCEVCQREFTSLNQWKDHLSSRTHQRVEKRKKARQKAVVPFSEPKSELTNVST